MKVTVSPSRINGIISAPSSKSRSVRAVAAAMLAAGQSTLKNFSNCDDALSMLEVAKAGGCSIKKVDETIEIYGPYYPKLKVINCGESALAARLMLGIASLFSEELTITGKGTLLKRKTENITLPLAALGVKIKSENGKLPIVLKGPIKSGWVEADGSGGSQFISGLLMALPLADGHSQVTVHNLKSVPYIDMTLETLDNFGIKIHQENHHVFRIEGNQYYHPTTVNIEGDWSGAAFLLVAGAIAGNLKVTGLNLKSSQADSAIMKVLRDAGAQMEFAADRINISKSKMRCFDFDATHCPDLFPPLAILAAGAEGVSTIKGVSRLSQKESNRGLVLQQEMGKIGISILLEDDVMKVEGGKIKSGEIFSHHDHRIAMAGAVAALTADGPVTILNAECVAKSYPDFFDEIVKMGGSIKSIT
jgi:3-phosphoshikimate 1-carboxyvinyltransferase